MIGLPASGDVGGPASPARGHLIVCGMSQNGAFISSIIRAIAQLFATRSATTILRSSRSRMRFSYVQTIEGTSVSAMRSRNCSICRSIVECSASNARLVSACEATIPECLEHRPCGGEDLFRGL